MTLIYQNDITFIFIICISIFQICSCRLIKNNSWKFDVRWTTAIFMNILIAIIISVTANTTIITLTIAHTIFIGVKNYQEPILSMPFYCHSRWITTIASVINIKTINLNILIIAHNNRKYSSVKFVLATALFPLISTRNVLVITTVYIVHQ